MLKYITLLFLLGACSPVMVMDTPIAYPSSCPAGDNSCERNLNAQTLAYIGHKEAATALMCEDPRVRKVMVDECEV